MSVSVYGKRCTLKQTQLRTFPDEIIDKMDRKNRMDGLTLLGEIPDHSIQAVFFDPQYRGILDKLSYGNEGKSRGRKRSELRQMDEETIKDFITEICRVLVPSGTMFLWVDKFHLMSDLRVWFDTTDLQCVDLITWNKKRMGMGYRTRRQSEYLVVVQKAPIRAKNIWCDHAIPDTWDEKVEKVHPHSKPVELQRRLIEAVTTQNGTVVDPAAGGYSVLKACQESGRIFLGCDLR